VSDLPALPANIEIDRGVIFHGALPFEEWLAWTQQLFHVAKLTPWIIGDTLNYGEEMYGEDYAQALGDFGLSQQTLYNYQSVCRRVPREARHIDTLPFRHHQAVAPLKEPEQQREWLQKAEDEGLTSDELRREIAIEVKNVVLPPSLKELAEQCLMRINEGDLSGARDLIIQIIMRLQ
jgi:hypothetical protein